MTTPLVLRPRVPSIRKSRNEVRTPCGGCGAMVPLWRGTLRPHNLGMRLCPGSWRTAPTEPSTDADGAA